MNSHALRLISFVFFSAILKEAVAQITPPPLFQLSCADYPDICDNHCNAFTCHDIARGIALHYDATSDAGEGDKRRTAIGCGSDNYCPSGTDCDEFPYASTYDGGLGCYPDGYDGTDTLQQSGVTRCADPTQNSRHGQALGQFYSDKALENGAPFYVGVPDGSAGPVSPLCDSLRTQGTLACPDESTGDYRFRTTPATPSCPARGSRRAREVIPGIAKRHESTPTKRVRTARNETLVVLGAGGNSLEVGGSVWTHDSEGRGIETTIVEVL